MAGRLPDHEGPIPSLAMKRGVQHIALTPNGIKELVGMEVKFADFEVKAEVGAT